MKSNYYWKNGSVVKPQPQSRSGNPFPRSVSCNAVITSSLLPKGQIMPSRSASVAKSKPTPNLPPPQTPLVREMFDEDTNSSTMCGEWAEDEEFDQFLLRATQDAERAEGIQNQLNTVPSPLRIRHPSATTSRNSKFPRMNSDEEIQAGNFHLMRARLAEQETNAGTFSNSNVLGPSKEDMEKAAEKIKALQKDNENYKSDVYKLKGEVANLRRVNDKLKEEQQGDVQARLSIRNENQKIESEAKAQIAKLQNEISALKVDQLKSKFPSPSSYKKKSLGNSSTVSSSSDMDTSSVVVTQSQLSQTQPLASLRNAKTALLTTSNKPDAVSPKKVHILVQTEESCLSQPPNTTLPQPPPPIPTVPKSEQPFALELAFSSTSVETREKIFQKIDEIVELRYQLILPTLINVVKEAPTEIMRRLVRNVEMKSAFPSVVDTMFQWGMDQERKNSRSASGLKEPKPPMLPSRFESGTEYYVIKNGISTSFKYGGTWGALAEVRGWLEKLLKSLEGKSRFRLYETNAIANFWRLMFWGNEFWRGLLFEEENEQLVLKNKSRWVKQLEGWTGLVLKCDWRDYFAVDLEIEVRKLTLGILENIVTAGYFEQKKNRYEILYRILKDVLIHDAFRNISNIQHILRIVNWSVADRLIMKHLCYKTNETNTCLARLIGENVLKVCREAEREPSNSVSIARLYLDYANLLETLMCDKPVSFHQSKYARQNVANHEDSSNIQLQNSEEMLDDDLTAASQFACPVKYNAQPIIEPMDVDDDDEPLESVSYCWLDPCKYEDPFGRLKVCQCRKVLMGTAISLLKIVFGGWSQKYLEYEQEMETQEISEQEELSRLELITSVSLPSRETPPITSNDYQSPATFLIKQRGEMDRLVFLQKKTVAKERLLPTGRGQSFLQQREWNWDDVIRQKENLAFDSSEDIPRCIMDLKRQPDIFDLALAKGVVLMNFIQTKSDNLAAALGSDAYKTFMMLKALLRLHMDRINFTRIERDLLTALTPECEEDHLGVALTQAGQDQPRNFKPASVSNPSVAYPIPLTPLSTQVPQDGEDWNELAAQSEKEMKALFATSRKTTDEEFEQLERDEGNFEEEEFVMGSGPFTYRPVQQ